MNVIHIEVPPLRQRREDVPALFRYFQCVHAARLGRPVVELTSRRLELPHRLRLARQRARAEERGRALAVSCESERAGVEDLPTEIARGYSSAACCAAVCLGAVLCPRATRSGEHSAGA